MPSPLTPEHLQLLPKGRLEAAVQPTETPTDADGAASGGDASDGEASEMSRLAKYELRRRQAQVPVSNRYASGHVRSAKR